MSKITFFWLLHIDECKLYSWSNLDLFLGKILFFISTNTCSYAYYIFVVWISKPVIIYNHENWLYTKSHIPYDRTPQLMYTNDVCRCSTQHRIFLNRFIGMPFWSQCIKMLWFVCDVCHFCLWNISICSAGIFRIKSLFSQTNLQ